jgi:hypothetical protein
MLINQTVYADELKGEFAELAGKDADHVRKVSEGAERLLTKSGSPPKGRKGC